MSRIDQGRSSIRRRLMLSFMLTTGVALTLASGAYLTTEFYQARRAMVEHLSVVAKMIGSNTEASLLFNDEADAERTLAAVQAQESIMSAVLYDAERRAFAGYLRDDVRDLPVPESFQDGHVFGAGVLDLFEPVVVEGERIGTVFVRSDTRQLASLVGTFAGIFVSVMAGALFISYLGATLIRKQITGPLGALVEGTGRMAQGDLSVEVEVFADDELGGLARTFNAMAASLRGLVAQVGRTTTSVTSVGRTLKDASEGLLREAARQEAAVADTSRSVEHINDSIRDVNASVETLSHTATETSSAAMQMDSSIAEIAGHMDSLSETIDDSAASVVEMTSAIREIARNADQLDESAVSTVQALLLLSQSVTEVEGNAQESHELSVTASEQAELGLKSVQQTVGGMQKIQHSFRGLERIITGLSGKSESIGEVVKVIEGVVEQTNLLALNAAIISSQAGEHGRAFAVVADEVRSLAERTAGSTREISELILTVQQSVGDAVHAMTQSNERVDEGVALSRQAGEILRVIGESSKQSSERIHEIVGATGRQALDIEKVEAAMQELKTIAAQLGRGTHEQDNASAGIARAAERMRELGQRVKRSTQEQRHESALISSSVETVAARINEILRSTTEQSRHGEQITQALKVFRDVTHKSSQRSEEMKRSLDVLSERSSVLQDEIGRFRLGSEGAAGPAED